MFLLYHKNTSVNIYLKIFAAQKAKSPPHFYDGFFIVINRKRYGVLRRVDIITAALGLLIGGFKTASGMESYAGWPHRNKVYYNCETCFKTASGKESYAGQKSK